MNIVAFDLSLTATGYAASFGPLPGHGVILSRNRVGVDRLLFMREQVFERARDADLVVIEGYAFDRPNQAHQIGELGGVIRCALYECRLPYVEVPPSNLKKFAAGKGNAKKDEVFAAAIRKLGYAGSDHNVADAMWLLEMARAHYERQELTKVQREALEKIHWPTIDANRPA